MHIGKWASMQAGGQANKQAAVGHFFSPYSATCVYHCALLAAQSYTPSFAPPRVCPSPSTLHYDIYTQPLPPPPIPPPNPSAPFCSHSPPQCPLSNNTPLPPISNYFPRFTASVFTLHSLQIPHQLKPVHEEINEF